MVIINGRGLNQKFGHGGSNLSYELWHRGVWAPPDILKVMYIFLSKVVEFTPTTLNMEQKARKWKSHMKGYGVVLV